MPEVLPGQSASHDFLSLIWQPPPWAAPFGLFFWRLNGAWPSGPGSEGMNVLGLRNAQDYAYNTDSVFSRRLSAAGFDLSW